MLTLAKTAWRFWWYLAGKSQVRKIFEGGMLFRIIVTTLLQIFCKSFGIQELLLKVSKIQTKISSESLKH